MCSSKDPLETGSKKVGGRENDLLFIHSESKRREKEEEEEEEEPLKLADLLISS